MTPTPPPGFTESGLSCRSGSVVRQKEANYMRASLQISGGVIAGIALAIILETVPYNGISTLIGMVIVTVVGLSAGRSLSLLVRTLFTVSIYYFGATTALVGRTTAPGLTLYTLGWALYCFLLIGLAPALALLQLWVGRPRAVLLGAVLPTSLILAFSLAWVEEAMFVQKHKKLGIGPTARWTVSNHWLSYDAATGKLDGSD